MKKILLILLILFLYLIASAAPDKEKRSQKSIHTIGKLTIFSPDTATSERVSGHAVLSVSTILPSSVAPNARSFTILTVS